MAAALGRTLAGWYAVERDDDALELHVLEHEVLFLRERGPHRCDNVRDPGLMCGDGVEVALDDHRGAILADRGARRVQRVKRGALVEERGVRRVDVLAGLVRAHRAAAEGDRATTTVADRHHESSAEPVVRAAIAGTQHPGDQPLLFGE